MGLKPPVFSTGAAADPSAAAPETAAEATATEPAEPPSVASLEALRRQLAELQGDAPLLQPVVDAGVVAAVVAEWTGIPVGRMVRDEVQSVLSLADTLEKRVIGQRHGLEAITRRIQTSRARLDDPGKPIGVFLLAGPSAWARPRRRCPWPKPCMAASKTSSPST